MSGQRVMRSSGDYRVLDEYFEEIGGKRLFLVCGNSAKRLSVGRYFDALGERMEVVRFSGFRPNPRYEDAAAAVALFHESGCGAIAAVGGGSAMDLGKCVKLWAGLDPGRNFLEQTPRPNDLPLLAVPTTAGTGSESTRYAVVYYRGEKQSIAHESCLPSAVLLDPTALETLPQYPRKSSMLDALCHGIESFWSVHATEESRGLSRQAIRGVWENADGYLGNTPEGNAGMLEAANLAGKAIDRTQTTAGHAMCYKLTTLYGTAHGHAAALCVAKLWPFMAQRSAGMDLERVLQDLAAACGCENTQAALAKFDGLLNRLNLETPRAKPGDFEILRTSVNPVRLRNHPVALDEETIDALYRQILKGEERL